MVWDSTFQFSQKNIDVLLVGEILIDLIHNQSENRDSKFIAGSPYNICKNLTKIGISNRFYGSIGNDSYGDEILEQIKTLQLDAKVNITNNTTSFVELNQTVSSPIPIFHRSADKYIYLSNTLITDASHSKILHFTYWPLSNEPSRSTVLSLIDKAKASQALIAFDPNYHPLIDDDQRSGYEMVKDVVNKVDIIKPSLDDSQRLFGLKTVDEYLQIYENLGAKLIIMTLGKDGLIARYQGETLKLPTMAVEIVDSTGAGDAFWSGLYVGLTRDHSIREALNMGLYCSAMKLKSVGADFSAPSYEELLRQIRR